MTFRFPQLMLCGLLLFFASELTAQEDISISGRIIDTAEKVPLQNVTLLLFSGNDSAQKSAGITNDEGRFVLSVKSRGSFSLLISLVGYESKSIPVSVGHLSDHFDLGKIEISRLSKELQGVTVSAAKSTTSPGLEKKTFDISKNISQTGGSVVDAMRNLPGISINQEGTVQLRGSDKILILIDGKQSGLTGFGSQKGLENIPASSIEKIEIINTPSARYDASGMAGIINIILKKERKKGFNGTVGFNFGLGELTKRKESLPAISKKYSFTPKYTPLISLNYRTNKTNIFLQSDGMFRKKLNSNEFSTRTYTNGDPTVISQFLENRTQQEYNIKGGFDWLINDNNTFTTYALFQDEYHIDRGDVPYDNAETKKRARLWTWAEDERTYYMNYAASYKHRFAQPGHEINASVLYTKGVENELFPFSDSSSARQSNDETHLIDKEKVASLAVDYTRPLRKGRIESGMKVQLRNIPISYNIHPGVNSILDTKLGNWSAYGEDIYAAYLNFVREGKLLEIEGGLRLEQTDISYDIDAANAYYNNNEAYHYLSLYPNIRFTLKANEKNKFSLFFNRRVDRPGEFDLRPFPKYDDPEILKVGNPYLRPQFTSTVELAYKNLWQSGSFYAAAFSRFIKDYLYRIYNADPAATTGIVYAITQNLNNGRNYGFELNLEQKVSDKWNINTSFNWYNNEIDAASGTTYYPGPLGYSFSKQSMNTWNAKLNNNFNLSHTVSCQLSAVYYAPDLIPQGIIKQRFSLDAGLSKKIKDRAEFIVSATDMLNTFSARKNITTPLLKLSAYNYAETQTITAGFHYKF